MPTVTAASAAASIDHASPRRIGTIGTIGMSTVAAPMIARRTTTPAAAFSRVARALPVAWAASHRSESPTQSSR
jgi:hypothetical protein